MKLLWVLLICLKEAQPAHVNVNVKVKGNANNDIEPGSMPPTWPRPPVQPNFPGNPSYPQASVSSRSLSGGAGNPIPRSSQRWFTCQSSLWTKECEDGKVVLKTLSGLVEEACEALCRAEPGCATFLFEEKRGDCALTNVAKGTSGSNGISGPELVHQKPKARERYQRARETQIVNCDEFHFDECTGDPDAAEYDHVFKKNQGSEKGWTSWQFFNDAETCHDLCHKGSVVVQGVPIEEQHCNSVALKLGDGMCAINDHHPDLMILFNCDVVTGRVDVDRRDIEKYDSCMYQYTASITRTKACRTGKCQLEHYGEMINKIPSYSERACKHNCFSTAHQDQSQRRIKCTHYKFYPVKDFSDINAGHTKNPKEGMCEMYHVNKTTTVPNYNCEMTWEKARKNDQAYDDCRNNLPIIPEINANTSSPTETTTTTSTTPATTMACNIVIKASDAVTSDALSDVSVTYAAANNANIKDTKKTGDNGKVTINNLEVGTTVALTLQKDNYDEYTHNIVVDSNTCNTEFDLGLNPTTTGGKGRIVMSWDKEDPSDVDLHLISMDCDVYFDEKTCDGNVLDRDNTRGGPNGPETTTVNNYGSGKTFIVATKLYYGRKSLCYGQVEVKIYPGDGIDTQTYAITSDCAPEIIWWFVGCFNSENKLRYFDFKNELLTEKPTLDMC